MVLQSKAHRKQVPTDTSERMRVELTRLSLTVAVEAIERKVAQFMAQAVVLGHIPWVDIATTLWTPRIHLSLHLIPTALTHHNQTGVDDSLEWRGKTNSTGFLYLQGLWGVQCLGCLK